jgi:hypothetical protein
MGRLGAGIDEGAGHLVGVAMFLEFHAEARGVSGVFFFLSEFGRCAAKEAHRPHSFISLGWDPWV